MNREEKKLNIYWNKLSKEKVRIKKKDEWIEEEDGDLIKD